MSILIRRCRLFDSTTKTTQEGVDILVDEGIVKRVSTAPIPAGSVDCVIDGNGRTALPGLMNLHTHPQRRHSRFLTTPFRVGSAAAEALPNTQRLLWAIKNSWHELLHEGVTTMRTAGSKDLLNVELRHVFAAGTFNGPRIISSGPILATTGGQATHRRGIDGAMEVDGPHEIRKVVRMLLAEGVDWIKLMISGGLSGIHVGGHPTLVEFTEEEVRTAVVEAHRRGKPVMAHAMNPESVRIAVEAGVDCIEHGNLLDDASIELMRKNSVAFVPTMSGIATVHQRERDAGNTRVADMLWEVIGPHQSVVSRCIDAGILMGTGTDTLGNMAKEISMFVECGMSHADALCTATISSARILGLENQLGSIEEGKIADIVLVPGNPLDDIAVLENVQEVILGGCLVDPTFLMSGNGPCRPS
jgi:imidazolonepropionase-like amidohydrolase